MLVKNYRNNDALRLSFNELAQKTFGLDFEDWYQNGYWGNNYNPYSIADDGKIVANVSVNVTEILWNGCKKHFIQLGTVMTEESYRNKGLIRQIMEEVERDYGMNADGMYLFANDSVIDFYPQFGYRKAAEYQCSKYVSFMKDRSIMHIPMNSKKEWTILEERISRSAICGNFEMTGNSGLIMFYVTKFMREDVYYDKHQDAYVIAEIEDGELLIHNIFSLQEIDLDKLIESFGKEIKHVTLGFTPNDRSGYTVSEVREEDTTLFIKGDVFSDFESQKLMFPTLSHA